MGGTMQSYHAAFALFVVFIGNSAVGNTLTGFADAGESTFEANAAGFLHPARPVPAFIEHKGLLCSFSCPLRERGITSVEVG